MLITTEKQHLSTTKSFICMTINSYSITKAFNFNKKIDCLQRLFSLYLGSFGSAASRPKPSRPNFSRALFDLDFLKALSNIGFGFLATFLDRCRASLGFAQRRRLKLWQVYLRLCISREKQAASSLTKRTSQKHTAIGETKLH